VFTVSVVLTTYQAEETVASAIQSLLDTPRAKEIEIIIVDDCSHDNTCAIVEQIAERHSNISLHKMKANSGSPSTPRNFGIKKVTSEYVTFLDDDDTVNAQSMLEMADYARVGKIDFLKGYLVVLKDGKRTVMNRLKKQPETTAETVRELIANQSTNSDFIIRKRILLDNEIEYPTNIKIGEDTVFMARTLACCNSVSYLDKFFLNHNNDSIVDVSNVSSTQKWNDKEINDQITAWETANSLLSDIGVDYYRLRLHVGLRNLMLNIVHYSAIISEETFQRLSQFANKTKTNVAKKLNLNQRFQDLYNAVLSGDYLWFCEQAKQRLLIAGCDLKFVKSLVGCLSEKYLVRIDEWAEHNKHDSSKSEKCAQWADIIWCEWLMGSAVYYTKKKNANQRLIVRAHRFEINREYGFEIDFSKVDLFFAVGYYYFEKFYTTFSIPREIMRLLPNYVSDDIAWERKDPNAKFNIAIVGILPARKGYLRGLELLKILLQKDPRYRLHIIGNSPNEVFWIKNNEAESEYYRTCESFIEENNLRGSVELRGHLDRESLYKDIGFVLSLSDDEQPESFHLAPAEGVCAGSMALLLRWPGSEFIYPQNVLFNNIEEIAERIFVISQNEELYTKETKELHNYINENYSQVSFMRHLEKYMQSLF